MLFLHHQLQTFAILEVICISTTIKDIAKAMNLSFSTVSRALSGAYGVNEQTRNLVIEKANELGYVPNLGAKELVLRKTNLVGILLTEFEHEARAPFFESFPSINKTLNLYGKHSVILSLNPITYRKGDYALLIKKRNLEGVIVLGPFNKNHPILQDVKVSTIPSVVYDERILGKCCSCIGTDERKGAFDAVTYLLNNGHRRIGYVGGFREPDISKERHAGYQEALRCSGITAEEGLEEHSDFTGRGGASKALDLLRRDPSITALFFANDLMAMGAVSALAKQGIRVPEQLSIIGFDGFFLGEYYNPPLTTVKINDHKIGIRAAEMLIELINGGTGKRELIPADLIVRDSVIKRGDA